LHTLEWLKELFTKESIAQTILVYGMVIAAGLSIGKLKFKGLTLGVTWVLFMGLAASYFGLSVNKETEHFLKEFGLVLFVYSIGLQVGPGFFQALKKNAIGTNMLAAGIVITGLVITVILFKISGQSISVLTGIMSGAVTNTPGLGAAQAALADLNQNPADKSLITLAYAVAYPFGVFGIILSIMLVKKMLGADVEKEKERHRKLNAFRSARPVSVHLKVENKQLEGQPLRQIFGFLKEPIVVSRMLHKGKIITPTPDQELAADDVLLIVANRQLIPQLKILVGAESDINLKEAAQSELVSKHVVVTRTDITHKRLGDLTDLHQHEFTMTRLNRAGVEMVPNGNMVLQLGDIVKVVGTSSGVDYASKAMGNSVKRLEVPDVAGIFIGIVLGVIVGSIPFMLPHIPMPVKIGLAGGPLIVALFLSRFGGLIYLNNYTTTSANMMLRELGISLFLASVGLSSGHNIESAFGGGTGWIWVGYGLIITMVPLILGALVGYRFLRKTYFELCGIMAGASTDPPALAFAVQMAGSDVPSISYATVYPLTMILRIIGAQLLILMFS
jgi:putative transport protein